MIGFAAPAGATTTLHFYSVSQQQVAYDPSGQVITNQNAPAEVGDRFESTHVDYLGTHKHHSSSISASSPASRCRNIFSGTNASSRFRWCRAARPSDTASRS